jgi:hypothetical protein
MGIPGTSSVRSQIIGFPFGHDQLFTNFLFREVEFASASLYLERTTINLSLDMDRPGQNLQCLRWRNDWPMLVSSLITWRCSMFTKTEPTVNESFRVRDYRQYEIFWAGTDHPFWFRRWHREIETQRSWFSDWHFPEPVVGTVVRELKKKDDRGKGAGVS